MISVVIQKYIEQPMIIGRRKFDIRQWVVVTSWEAPRNMRAWMYDDFYLRFGARDYDCNSCDPYIHLTNNAVTKLCPDNASGKEHGAGGSTTTRIEPGDILRQIKEYLWITLHSVQKKVPHREDSFEIFGFDFMVDGSGKLWLIEVNSAPDLSFSTSTTKELVTGFLQDVALLVTKYETNRNRNGFKALNQIVCQGGVKKAGKLTLLTQEACTAENGRLLGLDTVYAAYRDTEGVGGVSRGASSATAARNQMRTSVLNAIGGSSTTDERNDGTPSRASKGVAVAAKLGAIYNIEGAALVDRPQHTGHDHADQNRRDVDTDTGTTTCGASSSDNKRASSSSSSSSSSSGGGPNSASAGLFAQTSGRNLLSAGTWFFTAHQKYFSDLDLARVQKKMKSLNFSCMQFHHFADDRSTMKKSFHGATLVENKERSRPTSVPTTASNAAVEASLVKRDFDYKAKSETKTSSPSAEATARTRGFMTATTSGLTGAAAPSLKSRAKEKVVVAPAGPVTTNSAVGVGGCKTPSTPPFRTSKVIEKIRQARERGIGPTLLVGGGGGASGRSEANGRDPASVKSYLADLDELLAREASGKHLGRKVCGLYDMLQDSDLLLHRRQVRKGALTLRVAKEKIAAAGAALLGGNSAEGDVERSGAGNRLLVTNITDKIDEMLRY
eukprot:g2837.t1